MSQSQSEVPDDPTSEQGEDHEPTAYNPIGFSDLEFDEKFEYVHSMGDPGAATLFGLPFGLFGLMR